MTPTRLRLERIYQKYNPQKINEIDDLLVRFEGREDKLFTALIKKYGPEPSTEEVLEKLSIQPTPPPAPAAAPIKEKKEEKDTYDPEQYMRNRLEAFYKKYNPTKVSEVPDMLKKYKGRENGLFNALVKKYGPEPDDSDDEEEEDEEAVAATAAAAVDTPAGRMELPTNEEEENEKENDGEEESTTLQTVTYCPHCTFPPEYCEYGPCFTTCQKSLIETSPSMYLMKYNCTVRELVSGNEVTEEEGSSKRQTKNMMKALNKTKKDMELKSSAKILIERFQRQKRKYLTVIGGLDDFPMYDWKEISKKLGKHYACSVAMNKADNGKKQIQLQGDCKEELPFYLVNECNVPKERIYYVEKGTSELAIK